MRTAFGVHGPRYPRLGHLGRRCVAPVAERAMARAGMHRMGSPYAEARGTDLRRRVAAGERILLLGMLPAGHNSGAALVEVTRERGLRLLCNEEEERYSGVKNISEYPKHAVDAIRERLAEHGATPADIHTCLAGWDYVNIVGHAAQIVLEEPPGPLIDPPVDFNQRHVLIAAGAPRRLGRQLGLGRALPIVAVHHHDSHAYGSYAVSPFAAGGRPTVVSVIDGWGDDCSISIYLGQDGELTLLRRNTSSIESLGIVYAAISSNSGGWPILQSEGRYMGAAAWGDGDRLTNPYYRRLRQLLYFGADGEIRLNRALANWHVGGRLKPYTAELIDILGEPIPPERQWNPDAVLNIDDVRHAAITRERVDRAAALQLLFEDGLFHVIDSVIRSTGADQLVLTGGTALNCVANMRLLDHYDESWYGRALDRPTARLHVWVPPIQGDQGVGPGAAYAFAMRNGVTRAEPMRHAFRCGRGPRRDEVVAAANAVAELVSLGTVEDAAGCENVAELMASIVAADGVLGLFQGAAETGPRALGHRSILANPCNPATLETLNARVKARERIRPIAPMATLEAALELFELSPGAADDDYDAYSYMVLTARARPAARERVPAVIHRDGTARVQICRPDDRLTHAFLRAMGRRCGVEMAVNTSLNVGSPIVQTPAQALVALGRAKAMDGIIFVAEGEAFLAYPLGASPPRIAEPLAQLGIIDGLLDASR